MSEVVLIWGLIGLVFIIISGFIKYLRTKIKRKKEIDFNEFEDISKIKEREEREQEDIVHETKVMSKVYREAFNESSERKNNKIIAALDAFEATQEAQEHLENFKILDSVEVDEEEVNEGTPIHNIKENGHNIEIELFKKWARGIFGCIKIGTKEQLAVVKEFMSDNLYSKFFMQVKAFEKDGLSFMTEDLVINKCNIFDYGRSLEKEEIKVLIDANMKEYIIKNQTQEVLKGSKDKYQRKKTLMTFQKKQSQEAEGATVKNCPNCGTPVEQVALGKCKSCGTIILPIRYNWTLTKFENI